MVITGGVWLDTEPELGDTELTTGLAEHFGLTKKLTQNGLN